MKKICHSFNDLGYKCLAISALAGEGLEELKQLLKDKALLFERNSKLET
jgi:putative ribosome biogenesis GTPase RsgA